MVPRLRLVALGLCVALGGASLLAPTSASAQPSQGPSQNSDVKASRLLPFSQEVIFNHLLDLRNQEKLWSEDCAKKWVHGAVSVGQGASAQLVYTPGPMNRKLTATLSRAKGSRLIDLDHAGNKGFTMRWRIEPEGDKARVEVITYINPPPKPFEGIYFNKVRPKWQECHDQALETLERRLSP